MPEVADDGHEYAAALVADQRDAALWAAFDRLQPRDKVLLRMLMADSAPSYDEIARRSPCRSAASAPRGR